MKRGPKTAALIVAEPPAQYRVQPPLVVDCSVLCALLFQEAERAEAEARLAGRELHAPGLIDYEVMNVALGKARAGAGALAADAMERFPTLPLRLHEPDAAAVCALAHRYDLSAYDAAYLWLAAALKAPLATYDRKLGEAARRHLGALE